MKTSEVKCDKQYLLNSKEIVTVIKRIKGNTSNKPDMQSGIMFTGFKSAQKKFLLSNGETVKAQRLSVII